MALRESLPGGGRAASPASSRFFPCSLPFSADSTYPAKQAMTLPTLSCWIWEALTLQFELLLVQLCAAFARVIDVSLPLL